MSSIKVLHLINDFYVSGAEKTLERLVLNSRQEKVKYYFASFNKGYLTELFSKQGIPTFIVKMKGVYDIFRPVWQLRKIVKEQGIDVIHTHTVRGSLVARLTKLVTGVKIVTYIQSPILRDFDDERRGRRNDRIDRLTRPLTDYFIAVSKTLRDEMTERGGINENKITVIHNSIDADKLQSKVSGTNVHEEFNIPFDRFIIVCVAMLRPRKGQNLLIDAFNKVSKEFPDLHLILLGGEDAAEENLGYGDSLRRMVKEFDIEDKVTFTGLRDDVPTILSQCNLMVLASKFGEGTPLGILESMALGVPVLSTKVEGIPEQIEDGQSGYLVEPEDVEALYSKLKEILQNREKLGIIKDNALKRVKEKFNLDRQIEKVEAVYEMVCQ